MSTSLVQEIQNTAYKLNGAHVEGIAVSMESLDQSCCAKVCLFI